MSVSVDTAASRRRNWLAIALATPLLMVSYFLYAAAFARGPGGADAVEPMLATLGVIVAPFVFVLVAFASQNPTAPRNVLQAMGLLLGFGLTVGLVDPLVGAATGFAAGGAVAVNRIEVERLMMWRWSAVFFTAAYCLILLILITPAGVLAGALTPLALIGFADEYATWSADEQPSH